MLKDAGLILLRPSLRSGAVQARFGVAAELTDDKGLLICNMPVRQVCVLRSFLVPADVFVDADYIERVTERIVDILLVPFGSDQKRRCDEPCGIEASVRPRRAP